ncbi:MAG: hypothetical protein FJX11_03465 [Alphaproteobacteria bacterium]|nr:hypothetical protein [Alphaproteobacteria bacterium]
MTQSTIFALAALTAAGLLAVPAHAQQAAPPATGTPSAPYAGQPVGPPPSAGGPPWPVVYVTSIEVLRSDRNGGLDVVRVRGVATSPSWGRPHLIPITQGAPRDGLLDLVFQATAPSGAAGLGPFMTIEAILPIATGHPYKGVRVRGGNNALSLKAIPGYIEVPAPKEDCAKCLGKYFVARGASPPAGVAADMIVREADLPYTLRIIRPTDGIASYAVDPNRLTLTLSEDGRIIDGAWD